MIKKTIIVIVLMLITLTFCACVPSSDDFELDLQYEKTEWTQDSATVVTATLKNVSESDYDMSYGHNGPIEYRLWINGVYKEQGVITVEKITKLFKSNSTIELEIPIQFAEKGNYKLEVYISFAVKGMQVEIPTQYVDFVVE